MQLPIFPPHALDSSVITTVWVGLCVIAFLNLRFGTTMAGLVVPGYLVPMLLVKPMAAVVILGEALVTYTLVRLVADLWMRACGANELFGRDRYFAILLMSVLVRVAGDQWCLPLLGEWLQAHGVRLDWRTNLHSFGLVIVALTANQFWNGGVRRGLASFGLYVGLTWLLVRWVLVPFTNFDISGLNFVYEDLAANILDSPKAYMIILASALFASRLNLNFGWDFSGIMACVDRAAVVRTLAPRNDGRGNHHRLPAGSQRPETSGVQTDEHGRIAPAAAFRHCGLSLQDRRRVRAGRGCARVQTHRFLRVRISHFEPAGREDARQAIDLAIGRDDAQRIGGGPGDR
jgi:Capsule biosynthesis CapC